MDRPGWRRIADLDELVTIVGEPHPKVRDKTRDRLLDVDLAWLSATSFCTIATAGADGTCDSSPKGDPAGSLVHVVDDRTIAIAERPGNRRADGYRNILENPHVGITFVIAGRSDTLRINGRASLVSDAPFFDDMVVKGHRPLLAVVVETDEVYYHCSKAFLRAELWKPETWEPTAKAPRHAAIVAALEGDGGPTAEELDPYLSDEGYAKSLY